MRSSNRHLRSSTTPDISNLLPFLRKTKEGTRAIDVNEKGQMGRRTGIEEKEEKGEIMATMIFSRLIVLR